jgi:transcriptional regulator GlxA family with amidase domain
MPDSDRQKARLSVGFILARRFTLIAFANFVDVLRLSADEGDRSRRILCDWSVLSATMDPVTPSCGVAVQPNERLGDPRRFDYIAVVGGLIEEFENFDPAYIAYLRKAAALGIPLIGVCTGAFILHRAGLMDGYRCCVSWFHHEDFLDQFDGIEPISDQIFVIDRDRLTCAGGASSAYLAAHLVAQHVGRAQATKSLHMLIFDAAEPGEKPQPGVSLALATDDPIVKRALHLAQSNIEDPPSIAVLAGRLGLSPRQLERRFIRHLQKSPKQALTILRLAHSEHLLRITNHSIAEIATATGFCDASHFSRVFKELRKTTPGRWRQRNQRGQSVGSPAHEQAGDGPIEVRQRGHRWRQFGLARLRNAG